MKIKSSKLNLSSFVVVVVAIISQLLLRHDLEWLMVLSDVPADQWDALLGVDGTVLPPPCCSCVLCSDRRWSKEGEDAGVAEIQLFYLSFASKSPSRESLLKLVELSNRMSRRATAHPQHHPSLAQALPSLHTVTGPSLNSFSSIYFPDHPVGCFSLLSI